MVYKIQGNFDEENFPIILNKLGKYFKIIYINNTLYIALTDINNEMTGYNLIKRTLRPAKEFLITQISEKNIMLENDYVIEWCRDNLVELDKQRYERDNQEKLRLMNKALDEFERILQENEKGDGNG